MLGGSKIVRRLEGRVAALTQESESLRAELAEETQRRRAAEEQLQAHAASLGQCEEQMEKLGREIAALANAVRDGQQDRQRDEQRLEELERRNAERNADASKMALALKKLEKQVEQQAQDAATTAAIFLERLGHTR